MPLAAPAATIHVAGNFRNIVFNMATLESIEDATGRTVTDILFSDLAAFRVSDGAQPTPEQAEAMAKQLSMKLVRRFVAGCLGVQPNELEQHVPLDRVLGVFKALLPPFITAVMRIIAGAEAGDDEANPPAPPAEARPQASSGG